MNFTHKDILKTFTNVQKIEKHNDIKYVFSNENGSDYLELYVLTFDRNENEIRIIVDNYPHQRRFYSTNIPFRNLEDFENMFKRIKVDLPPKKAL